MGARFEIHDDTRVVHVRCAGNVTAEKCAATFAAYREAVANQPGYNVLVDFSEVETVDVSFSQMISLAFQRAEQFQSMGRIRMAIWAPDIAIFGTARMYAASVHNVETLDARAFRDLDEAMAFVMQSDLQADNA